MHIDAFWIPSDMINKELLDRVISWASECNEFIWLGTNSNTVGHFYGTELDSCVTSDRNMYYKIPYLPHR